MIRTAAKKVAWVGRTASMVFGLALVLALLFGVASMALAGTGLGATFNLGQKNTVDRLSQLVGSTAGAMLKVDNNGSGTALDLKVGDPLANPADKQTPPMKVDSQRVVTHLNADELDGSSSEEFASSTHNHDAAYVNETDHTKAAHDALDIDADTLDGKDSNALAVGTAFAHGFGAQPGVTWQFLVVPARVTVGAGQAVQVTSNKGFGTTATGGAAGLNLSICYRSAGATGIPTQVGDGIIGLRLAQNERVVMGLSAVISNLSAGSYDVGLCGSTDAENEPKWNSNDFGYTTALVVTKPSQ